MSDVYPDDPVEDSTQYPDEPVSGAGQIVGSAGGGFNVGLANVLGAPVDIANLALGAVGLGSREPFGGSRSIRRGLSTMGMAPAPGQPYPLPFVGRVAEEVGAGAGALLPFMGMAQRGSAAAQALRGTRAAIPQATTAPGRVAEAARRGVIDPAVRMAQQNPASLLAAEMASATSAGVGAAVAQELFPGDPTAELVGQFAGGFLNPTGLLLSQGPAATRGAKNIIYPMTRRGARRQAAGRIQDLATAPQTSRQRLQEYRQAGPLVPGEKLTAAQITGDPGLLALERAVARSSHELAGEIGEKAAATNRALMEQAADIRTPTDPSQARTYFRQSREYTSNLLDQRIQNASLAARQRVEALAPDQQRMQANVIAREELDKALRDARTTERQRWAAVPRDLQGEPSNVRNTYRNIVAEIEAEKGDIGEIVPQSVRQRLRGLTDEERTALEAGESIGDNRVFMDTEPVRVLQRLRSDLLQEARIERAKDAPDWNRVRHLDDMADATLADLEGIPGVEPALERARAFSRDLNERFTQGPVGRLLGYERVGGAAVPAELTLERSMGRMGQAGDVNVGALMRAVEQNPALMEGAVQDYLLGHFLDRVDPRSTGRISVASARKWMNNNKELLDRFPGIRQRIEDVAGSKRDPGFEERTQALEARLGRRQQALTDRRRSATSMWIDAPVDREIARVRGIAERPRRRQAMRSLVNRARKDPSGEALSGMKAAYTQDIIDQALTARPDVEGGRFLDGRKLRNILEADKDITDSLLSGEDLRRLNAIADRADTLQTAIRQGRDIDEILESEPNALFDMLARISGAQLGGVMGGGASAGTPLVAAGAGSRFMRKVTEKIPLERVSTVLAEAVQDPQLMEDLLARTTTDVRVPPAGRRLNAWLINAIPEYEDIFAEGDQRQPVEITVHPGGYIGG